MLLSLSRKFSFKLNDQTLLLLRKLSFAKISSSQLGQDVWVLSKLEWKKNGYFVEVGASDPINLSNTYMLEKSFGWKGLLIEPNPTLAKKIREIRTSPVLEVLIDSSNGYDDLILATESEFSTTAKQLENSSHHLFKASGRSITIRTSTLTDALIESNVPFSFDYLSIDIEGGELIALLSLDFSKFKPRVITIEHNFRKDRDAIQNHLNKIGYIRDVSTSENEWDDYYFLEDLYQLGTNIT
jgi:FkbM family methyltransferase